MSSKLILPVLALTAVFAFATLSEAETRQVRKRTTTVTEVESEGEDETTEDPSATPTPVTESEITTKFGSKATTGTAGCKTEELAKGVVRDLKSDCAAWLKDQKSQLKGRYLTGTCEEDCNDCGMSLQRCNVNGTVRYSK